MELDLPARVGQSRLEQIHPAAIQRCQLLVGDIDEVAVLARNNELEVAAFRLFHPIQFMLATPQETPGEAAETIEGRTFYAEDTFQGKPIRIRFLWSKRAADQLRWEQAFSPDAGATWETNWTMDFFRKA